MLFVTVGTYWAMLQQVGDVLYSPCFSTAAGNVVVAQRVFACCNCFQQMSGYRSERKEKKSSRFAAIITGASQGGNPEGYRSVLTHLRCCIMAVRDLTTALDLALKTESKNGLQGDGERMPQQVGSRGVRQVRGQQQWMPNAHTAETHSSNHAMGASRVSILGDKPDVPSLSKAGNMIGIWQYKI